MDLWNLSNICQGEDELCNSWLQITIEFLIVSSAFNRVASPLLLEVKLTLARLHSVRHYHIPESLRYVVI